MYTFDVVVPYERCLIDVPVLYHTRSACAALLYHTWSFCVDVLYRAFSVSIFVLYMFSYGVAVLYQTVTRMVLLYCTKQWLVWCCWTVPIPGCASTGPVLGRCYQHRTSTGPVLAQRVTVNYTWESMCLHTCNIGYLTSVYIIKRYVRC